MSYESLLQSNIISTLKLLEAPKEKQDEAITRAGEIILESIIDHIEDKLSPEKQQDFEHALRYCATVQEREKFLQENIPNLEQIMLIEILRFKYIAEIIASSEKPDS